MILISKNARLAPPGGRLNPIREIDAFLLSSEWRDTNRGVELVLWASSPQDGPVQAIIRAQEAVMFVPRGTPVRLGRSEPRPLRAPDGQLVDAVYFASQRALLEERTRLRQAGIVTLEADVKPSSRFAMERFLLGGMSLKGPTSPKRGVLSMVDPQVRAADVSPRLRALSLDIETDGWDGPLLSIAMVAEGIERVMVVKNADERAVLQAAFAFIREVDPDVLLGWNVVAFDLMALEARCAVLGIALAIGRIGERARVLPAGSPQSVPIARVPGRVVLDGVATLRNAAWSFERYTLDFVARQVVGRGKLRAEGIDALKEIRRMYREDRAALAAYNLEDARLTWEIFHRAKLLDFAVARQKLTGLSMDRPGGSVAAFDYLYLPRLHRQGYVAPDVGTAKQVRHSPGGQVLESAPGFYANVVSFDFRSLYPSIIRTFQVDPWGLWTPGEDPVDGFEGACFARRGAILPQLIAHLHEERTRARESGNETLSQAIKILMNSFYGVLGTPGCRFFDPRLASSITRRGHEVIERSKAFFEEHGRPVLYGDTDSLFVRLDETMDEATVRAEGARLARSLNEYWKERLAAEHRLESFLELRFDALYLKFLMPTIRGSEKGSKKRYAGLVRAAEGGSLEVVIRGLEAVRTDWTPLARQAQRELLRRVFMGEPWKTWMLKLRRELLAGGLDHQLVYRKRMRREVEEYASVPPHVKAARILAQAEPENEEVASEIEYVITSRGPQPLSRRDGHIDYRHYLDKQLAPALDVVLRALGTSFEQETGEQLRLI